jgi:hypothetical protein
VVELRSMVRFSVLSVLVAGLVHLFRFGCSSNFWIFLILTTALVLLLAYGDNFAFFDNSTGWIKGTYVDEPTPPIVLKVLLFLSILGFCLVFALSREGLKRQRLSTGAQQKSLTWAAWIVREEGREKIIVRKGSVKRKPEWGKGHG